MKPTFILLSKIGLGGAGGFGPLIVCAIVGFFLWVGDDLDYGGCLIILLLPFLPFYWLIKQIIKGYEKGWLTEYKTPHSKSIKVLVAITAIGLWILCFCLMNYYDDSFWNCILCMFLLPILFTYLYLLWARFFFAWLSRLRPNVALIITIASILLIIAFWVFVLKTYSHLTSPDYLEQYWAKKYRLDYLNSNQQLNP